MWSRIKDFCGDETKVTILFLVISGLSLLVSFFDIGNLPLDAAWIAVILCGFPIVKGAVIGLVTAFDIKADVLVSLALIASLIIGEIFAAGEIAFIMAIGGFLEEITVARARAGLERLVDLTPRTARVLRDGGESVIDASEVKVGDTLLVLPGETIGADGVIIEGSTSVDQSILTGESLPVDKSTGDKVSAGTVNCFGSFRMKAEKVGEDSSLQRMIALVQSADAGKAKIVRLADRWATWIVVTALTAAILTWLISGEIIRAVTILVVFCPCALVLATPTAIMAAIGNVTKYGILVREGDALERLGQVKRLALDKTGTLTYGRLEVRQVLSLADELDENEILSLAGAVEQYSEHPLGKAIAEAERCRCGSCLKAKNFRMYPGRGVAGEVEGEEVLAGSALFLREKGIIVPEARAKEYEAQGCTLIYLARKGVAGGIIILGDTIRESAAAAIGELKDLGLEVSLLTGDNEGSAAYIGEKVGISDIHSGCLPQDKLEIIDGYQKGGERLCMIGDGVNDAPALKKADVGIAMGGIGSDIAVEAADIALVRDDIQYLPHLMSISRKMMSTIKLNMTFAMALNFIAIVLAITGLMGPVVGALVHNAGSVLVIINSARLLTKRDKAKKSFSQFETAE